MKRPPAYTPATVLAGGIARLGDAMPPPLMQPTKPTKPNKIMPKPAQPGRPAKPAKTKAPPKDEDYSTPCQAPVFPLAPKHQPARAEADLPPQTPPQAARPSASVPDLDDIKIDDNVPLPGRKTKLEIAQALLKRLQPDQSSQLRLDMRDILGKAVTAAHKAQQGKFATRLGFDDADSLRVWRVA